KQDRYDLAIRYSAEKTEGKLHLEIANGNKSNAILFPSTGGKDNWKTIVLSGVELKAGTQKIKVVFDKGGFNLNYLDFSKRKK
ncbi:glycosyl hydrolase family 5, partial [Flavobacterium circumlabens]